MGRSPAPSHLGVLNEVGDSLAGYRNVSLIGAAGRKRVWTCVPSRMESPRADSTNVRQHP